MVAVYEGDAKTGAENVVNGDVLCSAVVEVKQEYWSPELP